MKIAKIILSTTALSFCIAAPATAQSQAPQETGSDQPAAFTDDIVVTAQFREQRLQDTPLAITAVNAAMLEARSQTNIQEISNQAPNVTLRANNTAFGSSMIAYIRGVGQDDSSFQIEPGVGLYVDDVYFSSLTGTLIDLIDLDRAEILRGPQGTLAGKNSIGGAIKLFSKKPDGNDGGYVEATVGGYSRIDFRGAANLTLVPDKLFARISGVSRNEDGYVDRYDYGCLHPGQGVIATNTGTSCKLGTQGGKSVGAGRLGVRWIASPDIEVNIAADFTQDKSEAGAAVVTDIYADNGIVFNGVPYDRRFVPDRKYLNYSTFTDARAPDAAHPWRPFTAPPIQHFKGWGTSGTVDWDLGDGYSLKAITAYRWYRNDYAEDSDGSPLPVQLVVNHAKYWQFSQELRLNGSIGDLIDYTVGAFYLKSDGTIASRVDLPYGGDLDFVPSDRSKASSLAGFAQATVHLTDKFDFIGGYRLTRDKKESFYVRKNPDGTEIGSDVTGPNGFLYGLDGSSGQFRKTRHDFRANVTYRWTDDFMTYAQIATGYKGGGINPRPYFPSQIVPIAPETQVAYEIGFKSDLFDRRVRLNMSAFYNNYKNIQLTAVSCDDISPFPGAPCYAPLNTGSAHVKGVEAETTIRPIDGLLIDASASYLDFKYYELLPGTLVDPGDVSPYTPKWKWSIGAQYEIPVGEIGTITPRIDASYQSDSYALAANDALNLLDSYTLVNARLTWKSTEGDWMLAAEITNLTNKYYFLSKQVPSNAGYINGQPGAPRRYAVTLRKTF